MKKVFWLSVFCAPGLIIHFTKSPGLVLIILGVMTFGVIASAVIITIGLFQRKFDLKHTIGFLPFAFSIVLANTSQYFKEKQAAQVLHAVEKYKTAHGRYPSTLVALDSGYNNSRFSYTANPAGNEFELGYYTDGINKMNYESGSGKWTSYGWND